VDVDVDVSLCNCRSTGGNDSMCHTFVGCTWYAIEDRYGGYLCFVTFLFHLGRKNFQICDIMQELVYSFRICVNICCLVMCNVYITINVNIWPLSLLSDISIFH